MFPLRLRSYYSLQRGTSAPLSLCQRAKSLGYSGLALTDVDNLYGLWEFLRSCSQEKIKPIVGAEVSDPQTKKTITCLVRNEQGYSNLCTLITLRHTNSFFDLVRHVSQFSAGLIVLAPDLLLLQELYQLVEFVVADLGAYPTGTVRELRHFAKEHRIMAVATPDSDMSSSEDGELYSLLQAVRKGTTLERAQDPTAIPPARFLAGEDEYRKRFSVWPEVIDNTDTIAKMCTFDGPDFGIVMPFWRNSQAGDASSVLRQEAYGGARKKYGDDLGEGVIERLEYELQIIHKKGFSSYFLVVQDIVHRKNEAGKRRLKRICGRGSGAASLVAYCLGITNVCPIKYNLYFERFLNPGRMDPPDIDVDFSWDERDEVLREVLQDYEGHAAMVCNHVFYKPRMAIRETAKAFGMPGYEISSLTKRIPWLSHYSDDELETCLRKTPALQGVDLQEPWPEILSLAGKLIGIPRYLSVHPGGVVITPKPISSYVPLERAPKGVFIIQWEKDGAEEAGLVKIDILGNRSLGVIRDAIAAVQAGGRGFDETRWLPEDDILTQELVAQGETMGCFYIESPAMRLLEKKAGSGDFEQLVIQSSIIRPAANEFVREYVRRLHGGGWQPLCPELEEVLDETYGLMVYQEDVSKVAVHLAGFSHSDADGLRKILSKKDKVRRLKNYEKMFYAGCAVKGVSSQDVHRIWAMMMSFDGYSFCKPHSASYARVSFQAAYLKCHHSAEFMAAVISNQGGYYSTFAYVSEAKRLGLTILPPDVRKSELHWSGQGKKLLVGLQAIHGLSENFLEKVFVERKKRQYDTLEDFFFRTKPADNEARVLIHSGGLDCLNPTGSRTTLLWLWSSFARAQQDRHNLSLFPVTLPPPPPLPCPDKMTLLKNEYRALGFLCGEHPLYFVKPVREKVCKVSDLQNHIGKTVRFKGWLLSGKLVSTRNGEVMEFLTFEDEGGQVETTFFPTVYRKYAHILSSNKGYLLTGKVETDFSVLTVTVQKVVLL